MINVNASVKSVSNLQKIIIGFLTYFFVRIVSI